MVRFCDRFRSFLFLFACDTAEVGTACAKVRRMSANTFAMCLFLSHLKARYVGPKWKSIDVLVVFLGVRSSMTPLIISNKSSSISNCCAIIRSNNQSLSCLQICR